MPFKTSLGQSDPGGMSRGAIQQVTPCDSRWAHADSANAWSEDEWEMNTSCATVAQKAESKIVSFYLPAAKPAIWD